MSGSTSKGSHIHESVELTVMAGCACVARSGAVAVELDPRLVANSTMFTEIRNTPDKVR